MDERRTHHRYPIWFPVTIERTAGKPVWSICRDASAGGVLVSAVSPLDIGEKVTLSFRIELKEPERSIEARVIRTVDNDDELLLAFPFRLALEFVDRDDTLPDALKRRAEAPSA